MAIKIPFLNKILSKKQSKKDCKYQSLIIDMTFPPSNNNFYIFQQKWQNFVKLREFKFKNG